MLGGESELGHSTALATPVQLAVEFVYRVTFRSDDGMTNSIMSRTGSLNATSSRPEMICCTLWTLSPHSVTPTTAAERNMQSATGLLAQVGCLRLLEADAMSVVEGPNLWHGQRSCRNCAKRG